MSASLFCSPEVVWRRLTDGGAFVVNRRSGDYVILNWTAAEFVACVSEGLDPAEIVRRFAARYPEAADQLEADLDDLSAELVRSGILESRH